jgi:3-hydroxyisobutyrate dehydrogenase-like beta-hydroxyacid dehydrogenase
MDIGFIGIGQMGRRMAARILSVSYGLTVNDLKKEAGTLAIMVGVETATLEKVRRRRGTFNSSEIATETSLQEG